MPRVRFVINENDSFLRWHFANTGYPVDFMSEFGNFLEHQITAQNTTGGELSARMGIDRTHFSQFINDRRRSVNVETLMKMVVGISDDPEVQAGLLEAYFRDQCLERFKTWISVDPDQPAPRVLREEPPKYDRQNPVDALIGRLRELTLSNDVVRALGDIAEFIPGRHKFRVVIEDLGKFAREELDRPRPQD